MDLRYKGRAPDLRPVRPRAAMPYRPSRSPVVAPVAVHVIAHTAALVVAALAVGALGVGAGCTQVRNPDYCDEQVPCPADRWCDLTGAYNERGVRNLCVALPYDGGATCHLDDECVGAGGPRCILGRCVECGASLDCADPASPVCQTEEGRCRACSLPAECQDRPGTPICATSPPLAGRCVECLTGGDCDDPERSVCDGGSGICRGCRADAECGSQACDTDSGRCVDEATILYVDEAVTSSSAECRRTAPCKTIGEALAKVAPTRAWVQVAAGQYVENLVIDRAVTVAGSGVIVSSASGVAKPVLAVTAKVPVTVRALELSGATDDANGSGVTCAGEATLRLDGVTVRGNARYGVTASGCTVKLSRSHVVANRKGGVILQDSAFAITNTVITENGTPASDYGGVHLTGNVPGVGTIEFTTIAYNTNGNSVVAAGLHCLLYSERSFGNNIVWSNFRDSTSSPLGGNCTLTHSDVGPGPDTPGNGNLNADPLFRSRQDLRLCPGSPCLEAAAVDATLAVDLDGESRPHGGRHDVGADEHHPHEPPPGACAAGIVAPR